ncbi:MAG TPA: TetR family transcriptional regulator [Acidimicrobiales bacterium]|nr:TetR family transcriptional regulator [Acidimicrobiales bacterium]
MSAVGRRPGNADTRGEIIEAAKRVFAAKGYDGTSLRAVARDAGVDPALVHHYFNGKASLFVAAMAIPFDPREVKEHAAGPEYSGARTIEGFLSMWDRAEGTGSSFASCVAAMATSTQVADSIREFVNERVWSQRVPKEGEGEAVTRQRTAMVSSQLMGLAFTRYILRVPPMSTATPRQIGHWVGPTLDRYVKEPLSS